ncbi:MAG: hypothetical protein ACKOEL_03915 [Planctomycetota bacterium]
MPRRPGQLAAALAAAAMAGVAVAQDAVATGGVLDQPAPSVDDLMKRLESLEDRNRELEARVTDLSRQQGEEWLGEQRASQIRDIVRDVLADSEQRSSLRDGGLTAGWNDGFFMASADGRFRMNIGGFVQSRFIWSSIHAGSYNAADPQQQYVFDREVNRYGFDIPDMQLWADGHVFSRDFQYMVKARFYQQITTDVNKGANGAAVGGAADFQDFELMDAWIRINLDYNWSFRAGQFRSPFSRGFLVLEQYQMSASRSVVDFHYALGYTQGIEAEYMNDEFRMRSSLNSGAPDTLLGDTNAVYGAQAFVIYPSGTYGGQNSPWWTQNANISFTGRVDWKPAGSWEQFRSYTSPAGETFAFLTGFGFHYQESQGYQPNDGTPGQANPNNQWISATLDAQANFGGASVYGALFYNYLNATGSTIPAFGGTGPALQRDLGNVNIFAAQLQGGVYLMPKVELFGRYEFAYISGYDAAEVTATNDQLGDVAPMNLLTAGINWYLDGQDLKWTTDLGWSITDLHPWFADLNAGWRPSRANEIVFRTQLQLMF